MGMLGLLRPSRIIRNRAIYRGVMGPSKFWKVVAALMFGRGLLRRLFGRQSETIDIASFGSGKHMSIVTANPVSRREIRRLKRTGEYVPITEQRRSAIVWANNLVAERRQVSSDQRSRIRRLMRR